MKEINALDPSAMFDQSLPFPHHKINSYIHSVIIVHLLTLGTELSAGERKKAEAVPHLREAREGEGVPGSSQHSECPHRDGASLKWRGERRGR